MMKKLLVATVAAATLSTAAMADTYAGAGLALENANGYDMGFALVLNGGMTLDDIKVGEGTLAAEGELTYSMVAPSVGSTDLTAMTLAAYAAYKYNIDKKIFVKPRAGLIYRSYTFSASSSFFNLDYSEIGIALGLSAGYKLNKQMDLFADFTMLDGMDLNHLTAGVQYHF